MSIATLKVRVLNASYMELGTTKLDRAMALVSTGRAVIEEEDSDRIIMTSGGLTFSLPKVIRLLTFLKVPFEVSEEYWSRSGVLRRDDFKCGYCGKKASTLDHIFPKSRVPYGQNADTWLNSISACSPCNSKKANKTPDEANMPLLFQPTVPMKVYLRSGKKPKKRGK